MYCVNSTDVNFLGGERVHSLGGFFVIGLNALSLCWLPLDWRHDSSSSSSLSWKIFCAGSIERKFALFL